MEFGKRDSGTQCPEGSSGEILLEVGLNALSFCFFLLGDLNSCAKNKSGSREGESGANLVSTFLMAQQASLHQNNLYSIFLLRLLRTSSTDFFVISINAYCSFPSLGNKCMTG